MDDAQPRQRPLHDPWRFQNVALEQERNDRGAVSLVVTMFLTGRECPWRCAMCDLWQWTIPGDTPRGAIPRQVALAWEAVGADRSRVDVVKLYNASNFFDPRAVPEEDYPAIAAELGGLERVIVESHPSLIGPRVDRFHEALNSARTTHASPLLEIAMGLETAHPDALKRIGKKMTVDDFARAAEALRQRGVAVRAFLLIAPPFVPEAEQDEWLLRSVDTALSCGSSVVSLIPTRGATGVAQPTLDDIERSVSLVRRRFPAQPARIFVDLWDLPRFAACAACADERRALLEVGNRLQAIAAGSHRCPACSWTHDRDARAS